MIVTDLTDAVVGSSFLIERVDEENELGLIKVYTPEVGVGFYYIGTIDRNLYPIYTDPNLLVPDPNKDWFYDGTNFWEQIGPTQSPTQSKP